MRTGLILSTAAMLALIAPAMAQDSASPANTPAMTEGRAANQNDSTTPADKRPGDRDLRSSNQNGGAGGRNSSGNGN